MVPSIQEILFNFIWYCAWIVFLCAVLEPRLSLRSTALIAIAAHIPYAVLMNILGFLSIVRGLAGPAVILLLSLVLFRGKLYRRLLAPVCITLAVIVSELLISAMLTPEQIAGGIPSLSVPLQAAIYLVYFLVGSVVLTVIALIWKRFSTRYPWSLPMSTWIVFLFFPLSQYILTIGWVRAASFTGAAAMQLAFTILLCIGADAGLLMVLLRTGRSIMLEARSAMLEEQLSFQKQYYSTLNEQYFTIRKLRHDISNHLTAIIRLLESGSRAEARSYADKLLGEQEKTRTAIPCANPTVSAFLTGKKQELSSHGIDLLLQAELPAEPNLPELDLITALGNLLDNAAEACARTDDRTVQLTIGYEKPYIFISTKNADSPNTLKSRRIPELERGMGTSILEKLAKDYDGSFDLHRENGCCSARLALKEMSR